MSIRETDTKKHTCRLITNHNIYIAVSVYSFSEVGFGILQESTKRVARESHSRGYLR